MSETLSAKNGPHSTTARKILGLTIENRATAARIASGDCRLIALPLKNFRVGRGKYTGLATARPGDLIWLREPFCLNKQLRPASEMDRGQSRITLVLQTIRTGPEAVPASLLSDEDGKRAGFHGPHPADQLLAEIRDSFDMFTRGNPLMVVAEFQGWRVNIDRMAKQFSIEI